MTEKEQKKMDGEEQERKTKEIIQGKRRMTGGTKDDRGGRA